MALPVTAVEFSQYLNNSAAESDARAVLILSAAVTLCQAIVNPLPDGAEWVVYDVAERAYANPTSVRNQGLGLYAEGEGPFSDMTPGAAAGGLWLTQNNKQTLRTLAGRGGAFTIDTTPSTAGQNLPWWDTGTTLTGDWDAPPT